MSNGSRLRILLDEYDIDLNDFCKTTKMSRQTLTNWIDTRYDCLMFLIAGYIHSQKNAK